MYKRYFGLTRAPFSIAPDPRFLYMSRQHEEAMAHLLYGIRGDGGFVLLTGEVGAGKTTICRRILDTLSSNIATAFIMNPTLSVRELLAAVCDEFGIEHPRKPSIKGLVDRITLFLLKLNAGHKKAVLILEEAQNLKSEVLEQVRLLTNLETNERKLLQIILIGQPELRERLARPDMRQLSQRIVARFHIDALSKPDVFRYVDHRVAVARETMSEAEKAVFDGRAEEAPELMEEIVAEEQDTPGKDPAPPPDDRALFSRSALNSLYACSGGIPRLINLICDRALLGAFVQNRRIVDRATLLKAAAEVLDCPRPETRRDWRLHFTAALLAGACLVLLYVLFNGFTPPPKEFLAKSVRRLWHAQTTGESAQKKPRGNPGAPETLRAPVK